MRLDLPNLQRMAQLVRPDEDDPLIEIERPERRMIMREAADHEAVRRRHGIPRRRVRVFQPSPRLVDAAPRCRTGALRRFLTLLAIEDAMHVEAPQDRRGLRFRPEPGGTGLADLPADEARDP